MSQENLKDYSTYNVHGTTTVPNSGAWGGIQPQPQPNVCPGCGKCKDCGRPYEVQPSYPQWTWTTMPTTGTLTINTTPCGGLGAASAQPGYRS